MARLVHLCPRFPWKNFRGFRMAKLSIREAAKHFDVSRPTLLKDLRSGKLSGDLSGDGKVWKIDPSELARCYKPRMIGDDFAMANIGELGGVSSSLPWQNNQFDELKAQLFEAEKARAIAEVRAEAAERIAEERGRHLDDLRRLLLTKEETSEPEIGPSLSDHAEAPKVDLAPSEGPKAAPSFWRRLFGG